MPDGECTWWPDVWLGVSLTDCCRAHDVSPLDLASSVDLGACVVAAMPDYPLAGALIGAAMMIGTALWCAYRYGPRGRR